MQLDRPKKEPCPKMRSGCDMKSVMRSNILRGSSTNVGKVTLDRSIPTLCRRLNSKHRIIYYR